jgi:lactate dehydrogenase-like 2-hydroxyacid dehydrogenase
MRDTERTQSDPKRWHPSQAVVAPVIAVSRASLPGGALAKLRERATRVALWTRPDPPTAIQLAELAHDAHALICTSADKVDGAFARACPKLIAVGTASSGVDHMDLAALTRMGIVACNAPGVVAESTADLTWALILATMRRVVEADRLVRSGAWTMPDGFELVPAQDVHGATLGIVGFGAVGRAVARRAQGFGMHVVHHSRRQQSDELSRYVPFEDLLRQADIVTLHVPLTDATRGLMGEAQFHLMKPSAVLVNTSRGAIVDERALVRALDQRWIAGAGLDVRETEPSRSPDPMTQFSNCVLLPHIGTATLAARARMAELAAEGVLDALAGRTPRHAVGAGA